MQKKTSNDLSDRARKLATKAGITYTVALESLRTPRHEQRIAQPALAPGFVLTPAVERFIDGETQINVEYELREFLAERTAKPYVCYHCDEDAHTATDPTSVIFTVTAFDPDLNPGTHVVMTSLAHASCIPSTIRWAVPAQLPQQPHHVRVAVPDDPEERTYVFEFTAASYLASPNEPDGPLLPVLLITAEPQDYEPHPSLFHLLDYHLLEDGFGYEGSSNLGEHNWSLRLERGTGGASQNWIAIRSETADENEGHGHFFLAGVDVTDEWVTIAHDRGEVLLLVGPVGPHTGFPDLDDEDPDSVLELLEDDFVRAGWCPIDAPADGHLRPKEAERAQ
ncbi:hypothetical protein ACIBBE_45555 [Streptomyces sp. NPDC051644]|uniref:hypothetical protein n=1 Tax=Streptomyces sp. NPDC051644 TaxID=3365666 RepID=UPI0037890FCE